MKLSVGGQLLRLELMTSRSGVGFNSKENVSCVRHNPAL